MTIETQMGAGKGSGHALHRAIFPFRKVKVRPPDLPQDRDFAVDLMPTTIRHCDG